MSAIAATMDRDSLLGDGIEHAMAVRFQLASCYLLAVGVYRFAALSGSTVEAASYAALASGVSSDWRALPSFTLPASLEPRWLSTDLFKRASLSFFIVG